MPVLSKPVLEAATKAVGKCLKGERCDVTDKHVLEVVLQYAQTAATAHRASITLSDNLEDFTIDDDSAAYIEAYMNGSRQNSSIPASKLGSFSSRGGSFCTGSAAASAAPVAPERISSSTRVIALQLNDPEVQQLLERNKLAQWGFDMAGLDSATKGRCLSAMFMAGLPELGLVESCDLHEEKALHYMMDIERQYQNNPFHSRKHAADVVQTILSILLIDLKDVFTPVEQLTLLVSAAVHDVGHQGLTNDFHESTMGELAVTYNGQSPNEHYHAATATRTLLKEHNNFLPAAGSALGESASAAQPAVTLSEIRSGMVQAILGTDLKNHEAVMHKAEAALDRYGTNLATWPSAVAPIGADPAAAAAAAVAAARRDIMTFIVHVADVSNVMKPRGQAITWADRFIQECQEQGHKETLLGLPNNFLTARPGNLVQSQKAFLEYFGCKCAAALERIAPKAGGQAVANCQANLAYWKEQL